MYPDGDTKTDIAPRILYTGTTLSSSIPAAKVHAAHLRWQREVNGKWTDVVQANEYTPTINDVGYRIRAYARGRDSSPTPVIALETKALSCARAMIKSNNVKFIAHSKLGATVWTVIANKMGVTMKSKSGTEKFAKWGTISCAGVDATHDEMTLNLDSSSKFVLIPTLASDPRLQAIIGESNVRDYVVASLRGMIQNYQ